MKHLIVVGVVWMAATSNAYSQITDIHSRYGTSGSHFSLPADTQALSYEATISGAPCQYQVSLEVYHNGVQRLTNVTPGGYPGMPFYYACPVGMGSWGLVAGDIVTFVLKVVNTATGDTLATHTLIGDVVGT